MAKIKIDLDYKDSGYNNAQKNLKTYKNTLSGMSTDANRSSASLKGLGASFGIVNKAVSIGGLLAFSKTLSSSISNAMDMIETANLFSVSLGNMEDQALETVDALNEAFGLDTTNLKDQIGTYSLLARSMGATDKQAETLATNTAKLALDLSSLTNVPINQVMADLKSGLIGQSETVYKYGIDVTEASLKQEALNQGITTSVRNMSQGQKLLLRYNVMLNQTGLAQGDFAKTIESPANQLRVLQARITTLSRAIGSIFLPMLASILPYLNAFVIILTRVANSIAQFFGADSFVETNSQQTALGTISEDADDASSNIDSATSSAKKFKNALMGIDEINVLPSQDDSSGTGGGTSTGGGISSMADLDLPSYDNLMDNVSSKAQDLADKLQSKFETILKIVGLIGVGILSWKLASSFVSALEGGGLFAQVLKTVKSIFNVAGADSLYMFSVLGKTTELPLLGMIAGLAATIAVLILRFVELTKKSESFRNGLKVISDVAMSMFNGLLDLANWLDKQFEGLSTIVGDFGLTALGVALLFTPFGAFGAIILVFEAITVAVRALGYAFSPAIEQAEVFGDEISDTTKKKVKPFIEDINDLDDMLTRLEYTGEIITDSTVNSVKSKVAEIKKTILDELSVDRNQDLQNISDLAENMTSEMYSSLLVSTNDYYDEQTKKISDYENEITEILQNAKDENRALTESENARLLAIEQDMQDTGVSQLSESSIEYETIMRKLKDNAVAINVEQGSEIIQNAMKTRDETIASAEDQYSSIKLSADRMLETGAINEEQYQAIIDSAKNAKDETIAEAEEQYQGIYDTTVDKLGKNSKYIDVENGKIKTKWAVFWSDLKLGASKAWSDITKGWTDFWNGIGRWWDINIAPKFTKEYWKQKFRGLLDGATSILNDLKLKFTTWTARIKTPHITWSSYGGWEATGVLKTLLSTLHLPTSLPKMNVSWYASGGFPANGEMFIANEAGPEMIGRMGNRNVVANNNQIVESVSNGVARAVQSVLGTSSQGDIVLKVGQTELARATVSGINRLTKQEGRLSIDI